MCGNIQQNELNNQINRPQFNNFEKLLQTVAKVVSKLYIK
jgi:hypothetical protein